MLATDSPAHPRKGSLDYHADGSNANGSPRRKSRNNSVGPSDLGTHFQTKVAILDAGAQYGKVIDRRLRELNIYCELLPLSTPAAELHGFSALVISGGPQSVYGATAPKYDPELFTQHVGRIPVLGICYGMQLLNHYYGGVVHKKQHREDGQFTLNIERECPLFHTLPKQIEVLLTHGDSVDSIAEGFHCIARSTAGIVAAIGDDERKIYGVQFHPEVDLTPDGKQMFINFIEQVCKLPRDYTLESRKVAAIREIRDQVKDDNVLVLVSGGVDSSVCAALLHEALDPKKIYALHIDNGFMRLNESSGVEAALKQVGMNLNVIDASETFFNSTTTIDGELTEKLKETIKPEVKRKIIGDTFMRVADEHTRKLGLDVDHTFLAQGTLRPDLIESASSLASSNAEVIKTHHNDTALVRQLRAKGRIIEPLKDLHKDEVRELGMELGLPEAQVWRQPFPGPGLAIRIICAVEPYLTELDSTIVSQLAEQYSSPTIASTLLPCRTVGVQGDGRTYSSLVALSSDVDSKVDGFSTAMPNAEEWKKIFEYARDIPKQLHGVNRVVYAFGKKLPQGQMKTITPTKLTPDAISQLQAADDIVRQCLSKYNLVKRLSQVPVVLLPVDFGTHGARSICIRTFITNDFMTGVPAVPSWDTSSAEAERRGISVAALADIVQRILSEVPGIVRVCYDLTAKPPATTEYE